MANKGALRLQLLDVHGRAIKEAVTVMLHHQTRGVDTKVTVKAAKPIVIDDLFAQPEGVYRDAIDPLSYLQVGHFVSVLSSRQTPLTVTFPVDPARAGRSYSLRTMTFPKSRSACSVRATMCSGSKGNPAPISSTD